LYTRGRVSANLQNYSNYMPYLGMWALVLWVLTFGFGEEIGWRGFALPRLQKGRSALAASVIVWVMWVVWHIPSFFYLDTYMKLGLAMLPMFALGVLAGAIVFRMRVEGSRVMLTGQEIAHEVGVTFEGRLQEP
jgi:membrane protease YdiL (CAAX protease family)